MAAYGILRKRPELDLLQKRLMAVCRHLCPAEGGLALGLSGGMDSLLLAELLCRAGIRPLLLHFNHGWRGRESDRDEAWVKAWAGRHGLKLKTGRAGARVKKSEGAAREARWNFFRKSLAAAKIKHLLLAHHGDDLVETFWLQLLRGAGPEGLAGLEELRVIQGITVLRPLLGCRRAELKKLARYWKLDWREDASNQSPDYFRNRVRKRLLPYLTKLSGRDAGELTLRTARILAEENLFFEELLPRVWPEQLPLREWRDLSVALQRRGLRAWLQSRGVDNADFAQIEAVRGLLTREQPARVNLSRGRHCRRRAGVLFVEG